MSEAQNHLRTFAVGSCDGLEELLDSLQEQEGLDLIGSSDTPNEAAGFLSGGHLDVVLLATRGVVFPADLLAGIREHTAAPVVLLVSGDCSGLLEEALEAGVADVLPLPQLSESIAFAIRKVSHVGRRAQNGERKGRLITVFSPKGGTGKTVIASNVAACLARFHHQRTLLLDLDLQFGDAAIMLGLEPEKTIYDLVVAPGELDPEKLDGYTTRHSSGVDVLPAPLRPEDAELVTEAKLARLLEVAAHAYDFIVVDTSPFFHGPMLATLDRTRDLLLVCGMDVPTVKNVRLGLQTLELLSFPADRIKVVLNRANSNVGIKRAEIERALETSIRFDLPSDRSVPIGVNRGNPVVLGASGSDFAKALKRIVAELMAADRPKRRHRRRLFTRAKG
jgi:pilus assembly protein CpaE